MLDEVFRELLVLESNAKAIEHRLNALTHCIYDTPAEQKNENSKCCKRTQGQ